MTFSATENNVYEAGSCRVQRHSHQDTVTGRRPPVVKQERYRDLASSDSECEYEPRSHGKEVLGLRLAPLVIPWERRMETVAVAQFLCTFFLMGPGSLFLFLYLFFYTQYGYISVLYLLWFFYDRDRQDHGGRRSRRVRGWKLWKRYCNFFPISLVKTADLDPKKNYLFAAHPHGVICNGHFGNFATEGTNFSKTFPGITPHLLTLPGHYSFPIYREYLMLSGACSASKESLNFLLGLPDGGHAAVLVPGGPLESLDARPGECTRLHLKNRKGFIKVAIKNGVPLVPVYAFGENAIYDQVSNPEGSVTRRLQNVIQRKFGLAPVIFKGRGFFQYSFGLLPQRRSITTVVGKPIPTVKNPNPTQDEIDAMHKLYLDALMDLFESNKKLYGNADEKLEIV